MQKEFSRGALIVIMVAMALTISFTFYKNNPGRVWGADIISGTTDFLESIGDKIFPDNWFTKEPVPVGDTQSSEGDGFLGATSPYEAKLDYEEAIINTVDKAAPAVVSIIVSKDVPVIEQCPMSPFFEDNSFKIYVPCESPSGKTERVEIGGGTGFIVESDGIIITNKHVVSDKAAIYTVFMQDGRKFSGTVVATSGNQDIAIVKIGASGLPTLKLGDSDSVRLAQTAIAIGNTLGEYKNTVSVGVISGKYRTVTASGSSGIETIEGVFQTDAAINPGNSGGPLLNLKGEVIGINTALASGAENVGFAIPSNKARRALDAYTKTGKIETPFLGIWYEKTDEGAKIAKNDGGIAIIAGSPAERAGLKEGDVIIEASGIKINGDISIASIISDYSPGESLDLKVRRGEAIITVRVTLGVKE
ncbi:MAG: trypsin-like peptidase domain-containing protein [Candidatus Colwellbacteria bacterium]|nr:trypsin-like peptidase domain-containing protein [Candidatus Colwellbacteria bacterium]